MNRKRFFSVALVSFVVAGLFLAPELVAQRPRQPGAAVLEKLQDVSRVEIKDAGGQIILAGTFKTKSETSKELVREAVLTSPAGGAPVKGLAEIEITKDSTPAKQALEMKLERLPASSSYTLVIDGKDVLTLQTNGRGYAEIKLSTAIKKL